MHAHTYIIIIIIIIIIIATTTTYLFADLSNGDVVITCSDYFHLKSILKYCQQKYNYYRKQTTASKYSAIKGKGRHV